MQRVIMNEKAKAVMDLPNRASRFVRQVEEAAVEAAQYATAVSQNQFRSNVSGRPFAPARAGRPTTEGAFETLLRWEPTSANGVIGARFDLDIIASRAPYWIIQEIGTGEGASVTGGHVAEYVIPSQIGRSISNHLVWASGVLTASESGSRTSVSGGKEQLYLVPPGAAFRKPRRKLKIGKEIKGKHFVQAGGREGFASFSATVRAAADNII